MKLKFNLLAHAIVAGATLLATSAQTEPSHTATGAEKSFNKFNNIEVKNLQDESLGRITDLGVDLINGRIVEVLVLSDSSLAGAKKVVAVPPLALTADPLNEVYRLNVSTDVFNSAPEINLSKWVDAGRSDKIAAAYYHFGQEPYFMEEGATASNTAARPKVSLGYVERVSKLVDMPVGNLQQEKFGKVWSVVLDIPRGRILNVIVIAPGNFLTKSIVPATALTFTDARDALVLDSTKAEFRDEPRFVFTEAAFGQDAYYERESYKGPRTNVALEQGNSYRDIDRTIRINKDIRAAKLNRRNIEVGTVNGRVTLRGWVNTVEEQSRINEIAIAASRLELVDNQIVVGKPVTRN